MSQAKPALTVGDGAGSLGCDWRGAQPLVSPPGPDAMLSTSFATALTYEAALTRLGSYYEEQVGRKLPAALPEIAPHRHFEVWHDMWVFFDAAGGTDAGHDQASHGRHQQPPGEELDGGSGRPPGGRHAARIQGGATAA